MFRSFNLRKGMRYRRARERRCIPTEGFVKITKDCRENHLYVYIPIDFGSGLQRELKRRCAPLPFVSRLCTGAMVNTTTIRKTIAAAALDKKQTTLPFFAAKVAAPPLPDSGADKNANPELPPRTDSSRSTPTPTPSQSSASPSERLTAQTSAPTMPSQMPASSTTPSSAAYLQAAKPLTKAQRKKKRIRACLKGDPCPCPAKICYRGGCSTDHIPKDDRKPVANSTFGTFLRRICGIPAVVNAVVSTGSKTPARLWVCRSCYNHAHFKWSLVSLLHQQQAVSPSGS
jgi:hypothetical protein